LKSEKQIHILHVVYSFGTGGMEKGIATLINHAASNFKHTILCLRTSGESEKLLNRSVKRSVKIISVGKKEGNSLFFILKLAKIIHYLKPDIVHTRNWGGMDGVIAAKLAGTPNIIHGEHGWSVDDPNGLNSKRIFVRRFLDLFVSEYICLSKQMVFWLQKSIKVKKKITQIYNGVDCRHFCVNKSSKLRETLKRSKKTIVFGIVARLDPIKNHTTLINAFKHIQEQCSDAGLLIIGDGPERQKLENTAGKNVLFLGRRTDINELLNCMDVFILPSFNEGISNTILEAMAAGVPVIASCRGGNPELIKHQENGFLFEPDDPKMLEEFMREYIYKPELRKRHGRKGRQDAEQNYSIKKMVRNYEKVWKDVERK
jgi:sugar transferase (PEP-CTERM/EpsH1 system associated)